jgi:hypothetical protein
MLRTVYDDPRRYVSTQSYDAQRKFGLMALENISLAATGRGSSLIRGVDAWSHFQDNHLPRHVGEGRHGVHGAFKEPEEVCEQKKSEVSWEDEVRVISSASPGYVALEVENTQRTVAPDSRWEHALHASNEARARWRLGLALSGAAVFAVALLPTTLAPDAEVQVQEEAWVTDVHVDPAPVQSGDAPRPVKNQKRAPCTAGLEVEVSGVCWLSVTQRPCPPQTVAYQGQCLLPVAVPRPPVTSLDGGDSFEPR